MDRKPRLAFRGATNASTFRGTPDGFSPIESRGNFRADNVGTGRPTGSRRPCLRQLVSRQLKNAPVQSVISLSRAQAVSGRVLGVCQDMGDAVSAPAGLLTGQVFALDDIPSMDWALYLDVTGAGGPASNSVSCCAWDPDGEFLAVATNYTVGGDGRYSVARLNPATGSVVWRTDVADVGFDRSVNDIVVSKLYTIVAITNNHTNSVFIIGYRNDTGALGFSGNLGGWANDAQALALWTDPDGQEWLYVAFGGSARAGTYTGGIGGGTIRQGRWALHFRTGIMRFRVEGQTYGGGGTTRVNWGPQLSPSDPYYEAAHGYFRLSEQWRIPGQIDCRPHGGEITALATGPDGSIFFAKRNQGWGPNTTDSRFLPDGNYEPYATIGKISPTGSLLWMAADTDSIKEVQDPNFPYPNDLSFPADPTPDPSIGALVVDASGDCYAAGRKTTSGLSVFALRGADGVFKWTANVMATGLSVREGCMSVGSDGHIWVGGDRNVGWDGASGRPAHLWKLDHATGQILDWFDLNRSVSALGVAAAPGGKVFYTTDFVS